MGLKSKNRSLNALLVFSFWTLGFNALVFQIVFAKKLILLFGVTAPAISTVLTVFFFGMALGSLFLGKSADKYKASTVNKFYIGFFLLTGLYGFSFPILFKLLNWMILQVNQLYKLNFSGFNVSAFLLSSLFLILPSFFLGGGLAVVSKIYIHKDSALGRNVSLLYFVNTFGGMFGAALTGFWLVPSFGFNATLFVSSGLSLMIALILYLKFKKEGMLDADPSEKVAKPAQRAVKGEGALIKNRIFLYVLFATGFLALALEVFYTMTSILFIGSSTYAFSMILIIFLLGIALGSAVISLLVDRLKLNFAYFGMLLGSLGFWLFLTILVFEKLPFWYLEVFRTFESFDFSVIIFAQFFLTSLFVFPPAFLMGLVLPLGIKLAEPDISRLGEGIGKLYFSNTLGGVFGSFASGFILIKRFGYQNTILIIAFSYIILGSFFIIREKSFQLISRALLILLPIVFGVSVLLAPSWSQGIITLGVFQRAPNILNYSEEDLLKSAKDKEIIYYNEGLSNVCVEKSKNGDITLRINGKVDASTALRDLEHEIWTGILPMVLHPDPEDVLLVGLGGGISLGAITQFDEAKNIDMAEIDPAVVEAAYYFKDFNNDALNDQRVNAILADARNYLYLSDKKYDVISLQPSNVWVSGNANLFTREFFELVKSRLKDDGIVMQWIQTYSLADSDLKAILKTFQQTFPQAYVFDSIHVGDIFMVGSMQKEPILDFDVVSKKFNNEKVRDEFLRIGIKSPYEVLSYLLLDSDRIREFSKDGELHTDDRTFIEFSSAKRVYKGIPIESYREFAAMHDTIEPSDIISGGDPKELEKYFTFSKKLMRFKLAYSRRNLKGAIEAYYDAKSMGLESLIAENMIFDECKVALNKAKREQDEKKGREIFAYCDRVLGK